MKKRLFVWLFLLMPSAMFVNLRAQVFDYVVAQDGSGNFKTIQEAIDSCPNNVRKLIFVKAGTYSEKVMIGSYSKTSSKLISLIGQDPEKVVIAWNDYNGKTIVYESKSVKSGTPQSATFTVNAPDFYAENISIQNTYTAAQAVALFNANDRQTFKNCRLIGYQDTHYLKKARRSYFSNCYIEGGVDYICSGGTAIFDSCTLYSLKDGGCITAPEDITASKTVSDTTFLFGFVFRHCKLTSADSSVAAYLGRPWATTSSSVFISCQLENIKPAGWSVWSTSTPNTSGTFFAEYNSRTPQNEVVDVANRASWSYQLSRQDVDSYYTDSTIYSYYNSTAAYSPATLVIAPAKPLSLSMSSDTLRWNQVDSAKGYVVYQKDSVIGFSETNRFKLSDLAQNTYYCVKAVSDNGNLSAASDSILYTAASLTESSLSDQQAYCLNGTLYVPENESCHLFSLNGDLVKATNDITAIDVKSLHKKTYIVKITAKNGKVFSEKVYLK